MITSTTRQRPEYKQEWAENNRDKTRAAKTRYRLKNAEKVRAINKAYREANPEKVR